MREGAGLRRLPPQSLIRVSAGGIRDATARRPLLVSALREDGRARHPGSHPFAGCRSERLPYSLHFINEESIAVVSLLSSNVFKDFPTLKILVSHGGGAIPYQFARFEAGSLRRPGAMRFSEAMRYLYYDTVLYSKDALELLFKTVGVDRCLFGTERPGVGTVKDPRTGRWLDETRFTIEAIDWLTAEDKKKIFEDNAKKLFNLKVPVEASV
jgi:predicted TIM-barrel fold metal-dependent hydrolase